MPSRNQSFTQSEDVIAVLNSYVLNVQHQKQHNKVFKLRPREQKNSKNHGIYNKRFGIHLNPPHHSQLANRAVHYRVSPTTTMSDSNKTNSSKNQQVPRRSTRSTRGQLDPFLQANYVMGEAATRPSPAPKRRRAARNTPASGSAANADDEEEEYEDEGEPAPAAARPRKVRRVDSVAAQANDDEDMQDCIHVAPRAPQLNLFQQPAPQQQQAFLQQVPAQQAQPVSPIQMQQVAPQAPAHQPAALQPAQMMPQMVPGHPPYGNNGNQPSMRTPNGQLVDNSELNSWILDNDPLFDSFSHGLAMADQDDQEVDAMEQYRLNIDKRLAEARLIAEREQIAEEELAEAAANEDALFDQFINMNPN
jgi:hypothetical protein